MNIETARRVEQAILRERGLRYASGETRQEAYLFVAMLEAAGCKRCGKPERAVEHCDEWQCPIL